MKFLLDTHIWVWSLLEPQRLSRRVAKTLEDARNELWLSPISIWEILVLCRKNRLDLKGDPVAWISTALGRVPFREATLTHEVVLATNAIDLPHNDPADRFLAASAKVYGLVLVTADANLLSSKNYSALPNR